jgi:hypothetical protein
MKMVGGALVPDFGTKNTYTQDPSSLVGLPPPSQPTQYDQYGDPIRNYRGRMSYDPSQSPGAVKPESTGFTPETFDWSGVQGNFAMGPTGSATGNTVTSSPVGGADTTAIDPAQSTLSPNFSSYIYDMLGRGQGLASLPYQEYTGQRFAGPSQLQRQAFGGIGSLQNPEQFDVASRAYQGILGRAGGVGDYTPGKFNVMDATNPETVQSFMNPYQQQVVDIQKREAQRQADKAATQRGAKFAQAGAFGGSRQAIENAEADRNLQQQMGDIQATGGQAAFNQAMQNLSNQRLASLQGQQYGEQSRQFGANLGLSALNPALQAASGLTNVGTAGLGGLQNIYNQQLNAGQTQQNFMQQPLDFGYQQFQESMKYPYQQATFQQSLLQGLPLQARPYDSGQSGLGSMLQGGLSGLALYNLFNKKD